MIKKLFGSILGLVFALASYATHNRAGEITYKHVNGLTYEVTVTTYTKTSSTQADRCDVTVKFGDGTQEVVARVNGLPNSANPGCPHWGQEVANDIKMNKYVTTHTFPSTGSYKITMEDPNRNANVLNIPNSVNVVFYLEAELIITASTSPNSSPVLTNPPIDKACLRKVYEHNPGAVDQDVSATGKSDSLSYSLVTCLGQNGQPIPGFVQPDQVLPGPNNQIRIDPVTGTLTWAAAQRSGEYNVAILITEWRDINGTRVKIGSVLRDMQIDVVDCQNNPPIIAPINDTCVSAGETLLKAITASDPDAGNEVTLSATGEPFGVVGNRATFGTRTALGTVRSNFRWETECLHVRLNPYQVIFRAVDGNPFDPTHTELTDYETWYIKVIAPAPVNELAQAQGNGINLSWDYNSCTNHNGFEIYRRIDSSGFTPGPCQPGVPQGLGYSRIATISNPSTTSFFDDDAGNGLIHGIRYCYLVYATFEDGSKSYVTAEFCEELKRDVPIITRVSINATSASGSDTVQWSPPTELDASQFPGPYQYRIMRRDFTDSLTATYIEVGQSSVNANLLAIDSVFVDNGINTEARPYRYKIDLYSAGTYVGSSSAASSIFLGTEGFDNRIRLRWSENVPWTNERYVVYRGDDASGFTLLDTVDSPAYTDTGLVNGNTYCYRVLTIGSYSIDNILKPLLNYSQVACGEPVDREAPCAPPNQVMDADCEIGTRTLYWDLPETRCDSVDDVVAYHIYYKPIVDEPFVFLGRINDPTVTEFTFDVAENLSVAGCYAVTAVDSFDNESAITDSACVDNCPIYELPNVFTPGGDGINDLFVPFPYRQVDKVDMKIFNRWGDLVFETDDPDILWDGTHLFEGNRELSDGAYFYVCTVYEHRVEGIIPRELKGQVTLIHQLEKFPNN